MIEIVIGVVGILLAWYIGISGTKKVYESILKSNGYHIQYNGDEDNTKPNFIIIKINKKANY